MIQRDWYGCYKEGWTGIITPDSFAHPAKFARGLIRRIYDHLFEQGYLHEGDSVVDPFGGVSLGALHAMQHGCHWIGCELEQTFCDMGMGCDCTGFTKEDWRRYQGRFERICTRDRRHICPECMKKARPLRGGKIPCSESHHYIGNIELWLNTYAPHFPRWGSAVLVQGDSRELARMVGQVVGASVSSPPYAESVTVGHDPDADIERALHSGHTIKSMGNPGGQLRYRFEYGSTTGNLGNLRATSADHAAAVQAAVASPPYADIGMQEKSPTVEKPPRPGDVRQYRRKSPIREYGSSKGQLGAMPAGDLRAAVSSPPYTASLASDDPDKRGDLFRDPKRRDDRTLTAEYGESDGQLGGMREGDFEGCVSSPPYEGSEGSPSLGSVNKDDWGNDGRDIVARRGLTANYGSSDGQLGHTQGDTFWEAARTIIEQMYQVLAPGAVAVWVCKDFVRNKTCVPFCEQWRELCEAVGFETVEWIRAWLVEDRGAQYTLTGELDERTIERKSFFRRLAERNGSPRIDYEVVIIQRKVLHSEAERISGI